MFKVICITIGVLVCNLGFATGVIDSNSFEEGDFWKWSYSEFEEGEGRWKAPYLFEMYKVVEKSGSKVTIEMFSSEQIEMESGAHHKFEVDIADCLSLGAEVRTFKRLKIKFYTKSFSSKWELVSRRFKALAFTEKFNCFSGDKALRAYEEKDVLGRKMNLFRFNEKKLPMSWYSLTEGLEGVALLRYPRNYKMEMVEYGVIKD